MKITNTGTSEGAQEGWRTRHGEDGFQTANRQHDEAAAAIAGLNTAPELQRHRDFHEGERVKAEKAVWDLVGKPYNDNVSLARKEAFSKGDYHTRMRDAAVDKLRSIGATHDRPGAASYALSRPSNRPRD